MRKKNNFILGSGISGLSAQKALNDYNIENISFESNPLPGGLTKSLYSGDFTFDHTGHLLHLAKHDTPKDLLENTSNSHWHNISRKAGIYINKKIIPAPFQYNIGSLDREQREYCIESFESRKIIKNPNNLNEYFESNFGAGINELFLTPYNEKLYDESISNFSLDSISRFFPPPDNDLIRKGFSDEPILNTGYNSRFWYPKNRGIQVLVDSLSKDLNVNINQIVESVDIEGKNILINGKEYKYDNLVPSIPLKSFINFSNDKKLKQLASNLSISSTKVFNIGISAKPNSIYDDYHWIYFPEKKYKFHRIGFYSNFASSCAPKGCTSLYVEVGYSKSLKEDLSQEILDQIEELGIIEKEKIECISEFSMKNSYVKFLHGSKEASDKIISELEKNNIYMIGRYGKWDYNSMEDSILDGKNIVNRINC